MNEVTFQAPDHLLLLIQQVTQRYIELPLPRKRGRRRTYSGLSFLLLAVVAVTLRTFKGLELQRLLEKDARLRDALGFAQVPHRKTIETRLRSLQPEAQAQVAALGSRIVKEVEVPPGRTPASAIDGRMYEARGPKWHHKQRKSGIIPQGLRNVDVESKWSKSGYRSWVQGYRLVLQTLLLPTPIPLFATWQPNNLYEAEIAQSALHSEQLVVTALLLGDTTYSTPEFVTDYGKRGGWLVTPKQLPRCYRTWKHDLYAWRKETIELLFQRIMQVFDLKRCPTKGLHRNGAFLIASVWLYQIIAWDNYQRGQQFSFWKICNKINSLSWRMMPRKSEK